MIAPAEASWILPTMVIVHALRLGASASWYLLRIGGRWIGAGMDVVLFIDIISNFLIRCTR